MNHFQRILVTTDTRLDRHPILDEAAEIASRNGASLKLVDVVPPLSWIARMTVKEPDHVAELMVQEKAEQLETLAAPIRQRGVEIETKVLFGMTSVEIIREVLRGKHDLVLRIAKAKTSRRKGFFGATGIALLRKCPCAVWLVCPTTSARFKHVMACVDTDRGDSVHQSLDESVFEISQGISQRHGADLSVLHAWTIDGEQFLRKRMTKAEFDEVESSQYRETKFKLDQFLTGCESQVQDSHIHVVKAEPSRAIAQTADAQGVDLVVMGMVARHGAAGWIMGSVTEEVLQSLQCSVLALKPCDFVSPVTLTDGEAGELPGIFSTI